MKSSGRAAFTLTLCLVFFGSGVAALVLQTLWLQAAGLFLGHGVWASSLVLSAFMGGLALGGLIAQRVGDRLRRPLRAYAALELAVALTGVALAVGLPTLGTQIAPSLAALLHVPLALGIARFAIAFALFLVPSTAMGLTLPLLVRALSRREPSFARALGVLYGANTLGAVAGVVLTESVLLARLGVLGTGLFAAGLCAWAALVAWLLDRGSGEAALDAEPVVDEQPQPPSVPASLRVTGGPSIPLAAAFLAGLLLLGLEVVWLRLLFLLLNDTPLALAAVLALVLSGIGAGSLLAAALAPRAYALLGPRELACLVALAAGALGCAGYALYPALLEGMLPEQDLRTVMRAAAPLVLPSALCSGALFTLLGSAVRAHGAQDAQATGRLALFNTLGAALGPLIAGLVLLPWLGAELSLLVLLLGYGVVGALLVYGSRLGLTLRTAALSLFALGVAFFPFGQDAMLVRASARRWMRPGDRIVAVRETSLATLVHIRHGVGGLTVFEQLATNAYSMSVNDFAARRYMELFVVLPAALQPRLERALVIGYGIGNTAAALTALPEVKRVDVVDISSELVDLARGIPSKSAHHPLTDPRVKVHVEDGRFFLAASQERWDLITGEPPPPIMAGVTSLYSREHFELMKARLTPTGMATYWLPMMNISAATGRSIIAAFCGAFEDCTLWHGSARNLMLVGTAGGTQGGPVSEARFAAQWDDPRRLPGLRAIGLEVPGQLGALFIGDAPYLHGLTEHDPPLLDAWPKRMFRPGTREQRDELLWTLRDTRAARMRFAQSAFVSRHFPARWQREGLRQFENQRLLNDLLFPGESPARQTGVLDQVLHRTPLTLPVLLLCGSDPDVQAALDKLPAAERDAPEWALHRAAGDLSRRDFAAAAQALAKIGDAPQPVPGLREYVSGVAAQTPKLEVPAKPW